MSKTAAYVMGENGIIRAVSEDEWLEMRFRKFFEEVRPYVAEWFNEEANVDRIDWNRLRDYEIAIVDMSKCMLNAARKHHSAFNGDSTMEDLFSRFEGGSLQKFDREFIIQLIRSYSR